MQLRLPWADESPADAVIFVRHRRARRYVLRVLPDGTLRVTLPRWGVRREARAFVEASRDWIARERLRWRSAPRATPAWDEQSPFLLDGRDARVVIDGPNGRPRVVCDGVAIGTLPRSRRGLREALESWLRARAARDLPAELLALACTHGISVPRVSIRNQRSRWGACSPAGTITLNWRLVQTPPFVREYVLVHELMHRRELNHSRRFWRLVAAACPRHEEARRWLNTEGRSLWPDCRSSF